MEIDGCRSPACLSMSLTFRFLLSFYGRPCAFIVFYTRGAGRMRFRDPRVIAQ